MEIISSKNKSVIKNICTKNYPILLKKINISRPCIKKNIEKMIWCGSWDIFISYKCDKCDNIEHKSPWCKSRFCSKCGKYMSEKRFDKFWSWRPKECDNFHIFFTIPEELRKIFCVNRSNIRSNKDNALNVLRKSAEQTLSDFFRWKILMQNLIYVCNTYIWCRV